jgi:hypothetical protein
VHKTTATQRSEIELLANLLHQLRATADAQCLDNERLQDSLARLRLESAAQQDDHRRTEVELQTKLAEYTAAHQRLCQEYIAWGMRGRIKRQPREGANSKCVI